MFNKCHKGRHHYSLCGSDQSRSTNPHKKIVKFTSVQYCKVHQDISVLATESNNTTTLPTAQLKLINKGSKIFTRGLFDQGSQKTFISQQLVDQLKLKPIARVNLNISGFLTNSGPRDYQVVKVLVHLGGCTSPIQAIVVDKIPSDVTGLAQTQQLANKFIEVVEEDNHKTGHYLRHYAVLKDSVTTPIRIVFNCSAKLKADSVSLNDCLQTGPSLTQRLQDVLLRFRSGVFAYTADISKAFLRVGLQKTDRDFTKFLWVKDPQDPNSEIIPYRFASVLFGATSSPFLLQATLDTHLKNSNSPYKTEISNNLYVDNFQGTTNDENKLVEIYHEANRELLGANMPYSRGPPECWQRNLRWDETLPEDLQEKWQQLIPDYNKLSILQFPQNTLGLNLPTNLHVFCDASGKAYGSVAYLVNTQQSFLLTSKARVAPIKRRSLSQMELTALLVGVRLAHCLIKTLSNVHLSEIVVWSDNEAVLQWVKNDNNKTPYVSNRVREIRDLSAGYKLRHVPTKDNAADYLSRGLTLKQLVKTEMWFNGPQWLVSGQWPQQKPHVIVINVTTPVVDPEPPRILAINPHRYSNLSKLLRVTEMVFDFINKMEIKYLFPSSIKYWVKQAQQETYGKEYEHLPERSPNCQSLITSCVICKRYDARVCPYPSPPPLPKERVVHLRPFETTGVDYTGALILTGTPDKIPVKAYIYLFTCATTRGVHLEVTSDMSAETFLQAFRRFAARRSCPKLMISDNGSNFVAGEACLQEIWNHPEVHSVLKQRQCYWKFIPPRAPWNGGFYERMVETVKKCLRKTLHQQKINLTELQTLVVEIEAQVNNRPLTYLTEDFSQREPLSPYHLIPGDEDPADPSCVKASDLVESYRHLSRVIEKWNEVWISEYLTALREYHYGAASPYNKVQLKPGDLVLVDSDGPKSDWPIGKIVDIHPNRHGVLRIVKVHCRGTTTLKTLEKLVPLELAEHESSTDIPVTQVSENNDSTQPSTRPSRVAAQNCKQKLKQYFDSIQE
ncbi:uncharacterized protein [Procambarus clarkii]|uniref:uncharacterized protein n=1 Tax=Procambarus clarkii TaxID=6728 RepID=UPI003741F545